MGKEFVELEVGGERDEKGGEFELNLELSIGGRYGKTDNSKGVRMKFCQENGSVENNNSGVSRSDFSSGVSEFEDLQRRKEIQALRRQEARRKREEKIKKSRGQNGVGFVEDKLFLEAQKLQARVQERETRERNCVSEEKVRKKDKNCSNGVAEELSLSLFTDNKMLYPKVQHRATHNNGFQHSCGAFPSWWPNVGEGDKYRNFSVDCDSEHSNGVNGVRNGNRVSSRSLEQCSNSAVSDYQSMSHKGGSSSDTGSHSSSLQPHQFPGVSKNTFDHHNDRYVLAETNQVVGGSNLAPSSNPQSSWRTEIKTSTPDSSLDQTNNTSPSRETSGSLSEKVVKPSNHNAVSIPKTPCVSTTGVGPNGRTIMGFLYKYTKTEVSIMCACHGTSFSPAGFVEHAGGTDTSQPLKHITIVPTTFR